MTKRYLYRSFLLVLFLLSLSPSGLWAQGGAPVSNLPSTHFDMTGFPQWSRDLRRAEIVAFGTFPFTYMFSNLGTRYLMPDRTTANVIWIAAGTSVLISLVDFGIERTRRNRRARETEYYAPGDPIIIRTPMGGSGVDAPPGEESPPEPGSP